MRRPRKQRPGPGQESVWDYPRPPAVERTPRRIRVVFNGTVIADSTRAYRVLETSHPPVYYIPPEDIRMDLLRREPGGRSACEWKGRAVYHAVEVDGAVAEHAAWTYPEPVARFSALRDHVAFYPRQMEACLVDDERAQPQPGGFYGGWITRDVVGPFKGEPGTMGW